MCHPFSMKLIIRVKPHMSGHAKCQNCCRWLLIRGSKYSDFDFKMFGILKNCSPMRGGHMYWPIIILFTRLENNLSFKLPGKGNKQMFSAEN